MNTRGDDKTTVVDILSLLLGITVAAAAAAYDQKKAKIEAAIKNNFDHYNVTEKELYAHLRAKHMTGDLRPRIQGVTTKEGAIAHEQSKDLFGSRFSRRR